MMAMTKNRHYLRCQWQYSQMHFWPPSRACPPHRMPLLSEVNQRIHPPKTTKTITSKVKRAPFQAAFRARTLSEPTFGAIAYTTACSRMTLNFARQRKIMNSICRDLSWKIKIPEVSWKYYDRKVLWCNIDKWAPELKLKKKKFKEGKLI